MHSLLVLRLLALKCQCIEVQGDRLSVDGELPFSAMMFKGKIESEVREQLTRLVALSLTEAVFLFAAGDFNRLAAATVRQAQRCEQLLQHAVQSRPLGIARGQALPCFRCQQCGLPVKFDVELLRQAIEHCAQRLILHAQSNHPFGIAGGAAVGLPATRQVARRRDARPCLFHGGLFRGGLFRGGLFRGGVFALRCGDDPQLAVVGRGFASEIKSGQQ